MHKHTCRWRRQIERLCPSLQHLEGRPRRCRASHRSDPACGSTGTMPTLTELIYILAHRLVPNNDAVMPCSPPWRWTRPSLPRNTTPRKNSARCVATVLISAL
eukprot:364818-Chlamydomonas_euryale.AAC.17